MKTYKYRSFASGAALRAVAACVSTAFLCSCSYTVYDMRQLDQPVVLNNNPFLLQPNKPPPKLVKVDAYSAEVNNSNTEEDTSPQDETTTTTTTTSINTAQLNAFLKIGGEPNYCIRNVSLDAIGGEVNLIFLVATAEDIEATGEVTEVQGPIIEGPANKTLFQPQIHR